MCILGRELQFSNYQTLRLAFWGQPGVPGVGSSGDLLLPPEVHPSSPASCVSREAGHFRAVARAALGSSLSFAKFIALSKKMHFCPGSAAFCATHLRYMFYLEITCVQDEIAFVFESVS